MYKYLSFSLLFICISTPVVGEDSSLASKCMAFCQSLASQGKALHFSLKIGDTFSFSLDTSETENIPVKVKKVSPSTQKRNDLRRQKFIASKVRALEEKEALENEAPTSKVTCEVCGHKTKTVGGMKLHVKNKHEVSQIDGNTSITESDIETQEVTVRENLNLKKHNLDHTDDKEKDDEESPGPQNEIPTFTCPFCDKTFTSNMNQHWHAVSCPKNFRGQEILRQGELMQQQAHRGAFPPWYPR